MLQTGPWLDEGLQSPAPVMHQRLEREKVVRVHPTYSDKYLRFLVERRGILHPRVNVATHQNRASRDPRLGLQKRINHPATLAISRQVDALEIQPLRLCQLVTNIAEGLHLHCKIRRFNFVFPPLHIPHPHHDPILRSGVRPRHLPLRLGIESVIRKHHRPRLGGIVILRKRNQHIIRHPRHLQLNFISLKQRAKA